MTKAIVSPAKAADISPPKKFEFTRKTLPKAMAQWDKVGGSTILYDTRCPGLIARKQSAGWYFGVQKKIRGSVKRASLGAVPYTDDIDLRATREQATVMVADLVSGRTAKKAVQQQFNQVADRLDSMTLLQAVEYHFTQQEAFRDSTRKGYEIAAHKFNSKMTHTLMRGISRHDVKAAFLACSKRTTPTTASTYARSLKAVYATWMHGYELDSDRRPAYNVFREGLNKASGKSMLTVPAPRQRRLDLGDHKPFYKALQAQVDDKRPDLAVAFRAIEFLYLSGMRAQEVYRLQWSEIDCVHNGFITLPPARCKSGNKRPVPFHKPVTKRMRVLLDAQRAVTTDDCPWVFPSWMRRGKVPIADTRKAFKAVNAVAGVTVSPHDLRRTYATASEKAGISPLQQSALVHHAITGITNQYIGTESRELLAELTHSAQAIETHLLKVGGAK